MPEIPLSKTTKFIVDNRGRTAPTVDKGIPLIATNCIDNKNLYPAYENIRFVSEDTYNTWFRSHPKPNDIILTLKGSQNGAVCLVPNPVEFVIAQDMVALRADEDIIDPLFLFAALRLEDVQLQIKNLDVSGVIPHFKKSDFDKLLLPYPKKELQTFIGNFYYSLCKKIDLLHRQNKNLDQFAETLFRQWFVEEAEEDCKVGKLGEIISIYDSKRIPVSSGERARMKTGILYPYYGASTIMDYVNDFIFEGEYILMGEDGTVQTDDGYPVLQLPIGKFWVNNHAHIFQAKQPYSNYFVYIFLKQINISGIVTGAVQPKINQEALKGIEFPLFPKERVSEFVNISNYYWNKIKLNTSQIQTLTQLRDTLLPKLISGEILINNDTANDN